MSTDLLYEDSTKEDLRQAWGGFLTELGDRAGGWDWWVTLTFKPTEARYKQYTERSGIFYQGRAFTVLDKPGYNKPGWGYTQGAWDALVRELELRKGMLGTIRWVRGREYQHWRGVPHFHGLIGGIGELRRDEAWAWWFERYGIARILPYDRSMGAGFYLCKYVTKELGDIEFSEGLTLR